MNASSSRKLDLQRRIFLLKIIKAKNNTIFIFKLKAIFSMLKFKNISRLLFYWFISYFWLWISTLKNSALTLFPDKSVLNSRYIVIVMTKISVRKNKCWTTSPKGHERQKLIAFLFTTLGPIFYLVNFCTFI